jgi:hypothetical protein
VDEVIEYKYACLSDHFPNMKHFIFLEYLFNQRKHMENKRK